MIRIPSSAGAVFLAGALLACGAAHAAAPAPVTPVPSEPPLNASVRDVRDLREAVLSPDGTQVAAVITASTAEGGQTHLWLLGADGKSARQATFSGGEAEPGEQAAAWSHDGASLFFLAKRGKAARLYRLPMSGGEAVGLTLARPAAGPARSGWNLDAGEDPQAQQQHFDVSPDDRWVAVIAEDPDTPARDAQVKKKDDGNEVGRDDLKKARLYLVELATGKAREVALPDSAESARWSPDSSELVVVTSPADIDLPPASRVWRVRADGASTQLAALPVTTHAPQWSAGGLVYEAQCEDDAPPGCIELFAYDFAAGAARGLTRGLKGTVVDNFVVETGGRSLVTPIQTGMRQRLARIDLASGALAWIDFPQPVVFNIDAGPRQAGWALLAGGPLQPKSVFFVPKLGDAPVKLAGPVLVPDGWPATPSQILTWNNAGLTIEGALYLPKLAPGARAPLVVVVHGGPTGLFQDRNYNLVNLLIAQGWAVLQTNPRGSFGYGASFEAAVKNDMGGADYADIMAGVDTALAGFPLDPARMALIGYSYGGEMAGFAEGRTDRFKALVSGAPVIDQFSEYGTEGSSFYDRWFYGKPWDHFEDVWRQSPLARVGQAKTPLLLLQGVDDPSDPLGQSLEMRRAMAQVGAPVTMVSYPRETHFTLGRNFAAEASREPWHGVDLRRRMIHFIADAFAGRAPGVGS
jgi:dipeptidyl aminopeptidase/acylaminoacyl peptidase